VCALNTRREGTSLFSELGINSTPGDRPSRTDWPGFICDPVRLIYRPRLICSPFCTTFRYPLTNCPHGGKPYCGFHKRTTLLQTTLNFCNPGRRRIPGHTSILCRRSWLFLTFEKTLGSTFGTRAGQIGHFGGTNVNSNSRPPARERTP